MSIAINYVILINIIVECVLLVINYTRIAGFAHKNQMKINENLSLQFLISKWEKRNEKKVRNITSQFEAWLGHGHVFIAAFRINVVSRFSRSRKKNISDTCFTMYFSPCIYVSTLKKKRDSSTEIWIKRRRSGWLNIINKWILNHFLAFRFSKYFFASVATEMFDDLHEY